MSQTVACVTHCVHVATLIVLVGVAQGVRQPKEAGGRAGFRGGGAGAGQGSEAGGGRVKRQGGGRVQSQGGAGFRGRGGRVQRQGESRVQRQGGGSSEAGGGGRVQRQVLSDHLPAINGSLCDTTAAPLCRSNRLYLTLLLLPLYAGVAWRSSIPRLLGSS
jgi:hypothetical protein